MDIKKFADVIFNAMVTLVLLVAIGFMLMAKANAPIVVVEALPQPSAVTAPVEEACEQPLVIECVVNVVEEPKPTTYSQDELDMLALVIYQEAGADACTDKARQMVGEVVLNRVADDRYPDTMEGVLTQVMPSGYGAYGRLHWTGIVWPERASYLSEAHAVDRAYDIAEKLLSGSVERLLPEDVVFQAEFVQGTECVEQQDGFFFCR